MSSNQVSLIGVGRIFIGLRSGGKLRFVGQVKEFKLEISEETKELKDYVNGGGLAESVSFISKVEASFNFASLSTQNLAMALRGVDDVTTAITKTDEAHTAYQGGLIPLSGVGPTSVGVTVDPPPWSATTAYAVGEIVKPTVGTHFYRCAVAGTSSGTEPVAWKTDGTQTSDGATLKWDDMGTMALAITEYEITSAGLFVSEASSKIAATGTPVKVTYTTTAGSIIQTLVRSGEEYRIVFAGKNFARSGKPLSVDIFRAKFSPAKDLSLISDDFASLTLTASVLADDTKTGTDISTFCKIEMVEG
jgi:hypothetical protein